MILNNNLLEIKNKNYIYNELYINSIKYIYKQIKLNNTDKKYIDCRYILYKTSNERYNIECILNTLFPYLRLDFNLEKFGRSRSFYDSHGRMYKQQQKNKQNYIPFNFLLGENYEEPVVTPINIKYRDYNEHVKSICINNNNINELLIKEPILKLLHTDNAKGHTVMYKNIDLTSFYYELNDNLYDELNLISMDNRILTTDIRMYRAIYHTNPKNHIKILEKINIIYKKILNNVNNTNYNVHLYNKNIKLVKKIYWWLSHATLYERGSCAITEIFCNALFLFIDINKEFKIFKNARTDHNTYYNTDIEAMLISNPNTFINNFDTYIKFDIIPETGKYKKLDINKIINGHNNNNNKRLFDYKYIENINILNYLSNFSINDNENNLINDLINEF